MSSHRCLACAGLRLTIEGGLSSSFSKSGDNLGERLWRQLAERCVAALWVCPRVPSDAVLRNRRIREHLSKGGGVSWILEDG